MTKSRKQPAPTDEVARVETRNGSKRRSANGLVERWGWAVLVVVPLLVYLKTISFGITHLDDFIFIFDKDAFNSRFTNLFRVFSIGVFMEKDIYYRPLFLATFVIERAFVDLENSLTAYRLYHCTNLALHIGCVLLLHRFLKALDVTQRGALLLALLFAVHPALTMAVAWIPGRNDTLLTLFVLGFFVNLYAYLQQYDKKHLLWQFLFFSGAVFTKETAVFVPAVATLYLWAMRVNPFGTRSLLVHATWVPVVVLWYALRSRVLDTTQDARSWTQVATDAFSRLPAYLVYLGKSFFPFNLSVYPTLINETVWFGIAAVAVLAVLFYFTAARPYRIWLFGMGWFAVFIAPFLLVPPNVNDQLFEHRLYLPMVGLLVALGHTLVFNGSVKFNRVAAGSVAVAVLFATLVIRYLPIFNDSIRFWQSAVAASPQFSYAHKLLGVRYIQNNQKEKALPEFKRAYELNKQEKHVRFFIARDELIPAGKTDEATKLLYEEIKLNPTYTEAYFQLSHLYFQQNKLDSTLKYLLLSREHQPNDPMINNNLLLTFIQLGDYGGAKNQMAFMQQNGLVVDGGAAAKVEAMKR